MFKSGKTNFLSLSKNDRRRLLCERGGEVGLVEAVTSGQDGRRRFHVADKVGEVEEAVDSVLVTFTHRDERNRNLGGNTDSILDVEVLGVDISRWLE